MTAIDTFFDTQFIRFVTGTTPDMLVDKIMAVAEAIRPRFVKVAIMCAITAKKAYIQSIQSSVAQDIDVAREIQTNWTLNNEINFSAMAMAGHLLMAKGYMSKTRVVSAYKDKFDEVHFFKINIRKMGPKRAEVVMDIQRRMGQEMFNAAVERLPNPTGAFDPEPKVNIEGERNNEALAEGRNVRQRTTRHTPAVATMEVDTQAGQR
jgi:hypothetical protein